MASPPPPTIPDELLEEIFIRLPTPDALARTSTACSSFRRVIKGRAFRRRFRTLHRPPLLGFMDAGGFHPAQAPHPSAPLAGALAPCAADFSFVPAVVSSASYVRPGVQEDDGEGPRWRPRDVRDGRVLLDWRSFYPRSVHMWSYREDCARRLVRILMDSSELGDEERCDRPTWTKRERCNAADFHLAVCDPLSSRYVLLPTIPEDLAAQAAGSPPWIRARACSQHQGRRRGRALRGLALNITRKEDKNKRLTTVVPATRSARAIDSGRRVMPRDRVLPKDVILGEFVKMDLMKEHPKCKELRDMLSRDRG
uniref:Uncharacterized protein n=1 Tax=Aegilops tauschii TaxID=37682 RepID=N1QYY1_AEGTA